MKYIDQLNWFSNYCLQQDIPSREILLYHCLLSVWNRSGRGACFFAKPMMLQSLSGMNANAVCHARSSLCKRGLISYDSRTKEYAINDIGGEEEIASQCKDKNGDNSENNCETNGKDNSQTICGQSQDKNGNNGTTIPYKVYIEKEKELEKDIYIPPTPKPDLFAQFWAAYPRRVSKTDAEKAFKALKPTPALLDIILADIVDQKQSKGWQEDEGKYIPYPASYLRKRRWEREKPLEDPAPPEPPPPVVVTPDMDVDKRIFGPNDNPLEAIP